MWFPKIKKIQKLNLLKSGLNGGQKGILFFVHVNMNVSHIILILVANWQEIFGEWLINLCPKTESSEVTLSYFKLRISKDRIFQTCCIGNMYLTCQVFFSNRSLNLFESSLWMKWNAITENIESHCAAKQISNSYVWISLTRGSHIFFRSDREKISQIS